MMMLYYSGGEHHTEGVGFAVNRKCLDYVVGFQLLTSRITVLTLTGTMKTHIVAVYAPTEMSSEESRDEFYDRLQVALDTLPRRDIIITAGDVNAHIGTNRDGWNNVTGSLRYGNMNDNGFRLFSFAAANNFIISNTYFQHPLKHRLTWRMPSGKDTAILDYFFIRSRFGNAVHERYGYSDIFEGQPVIVMPDNVPTEAKRIRENLKKVFFSRDGIH
ncbi:unnamed protein product [Nippostrongylus brasiliensis]|uniref:Craniofacial development protein 2-like n=1 Tax=Nippostrongylus brasiliensis TaxID=27835 RepID=A0A0N4XF50_NIPBR|nr:hypothetical protein Q1695_012459 [Nippostrongylus brasiliensis]VDL64431.1 unnamed protein product [Nippostrongylus brasiliensis]